MFKIKRENITTVLEVVGRKPEGLVSTLQSNFCFWRSSEQFWRRSPASRSPSRWRHCCRSSPWCRRPRSSSRWRQLFSRCRRARRLPDLKIQYNRMSHEPNLKNYRQHLSKESFERYYTFTHCQVYNNNTCIFHSKGLLTLCYNAEILFRRFYRNN